MTPERWQEVKRLFDAALERPEAERTGFLDTSCGSDADLRREVTALLVALDDAGSRFEGPALVADPLLNRQLGPYRILRRLGTGGMGAVYLAARVDDQFRRLVAVKAIRPELLDEHTRRRFENERHTLAALEHPNIVRLLDGGATPDDIPYLVMDYVEGEPIDKYCNEHSLTTAERLDLFLPLCAAVQYAHQNLVVHRDLKPANVLVTREGVPKLMDFGIAKLLRPEYAGGAVGLTRTSAQPMTPEFASPEQIMGRTVTTASDIYALGVVLFTLLTGHHPFEEQTKSSYELERAICETQPVKPSQAAPPDRVRQLRGDLDTIVLTAMRKEPQKRYASAERLAEDIRRYQLGQPVSARGDSLGYRAQKFFLRHKLAAGASAAATVLLVALAVSNWINLRRAEDRFAKLRSFSNFVIKDLDKAMRTQGITGAREEVVAKASAYLDSLAKEAKGDDTLELDLVNGYLSLAEIQGSLFASNVGRQDAASQSAAKALAAADDLARRRPDDAGVRSARRRALEMLGDTAAGDSDALVHYGKALEMASGDPVAVFGIASKMAHMQEETDAAAALGSYRQCESAARDWMARNPSEATAQKALAFAKENAGWYALLAGEPSDAEQRVREAIGLYESSAGAKPSIRARHNIAIAYKRLAEIQKRTGKAADALENCRRALAISEASHAEDPKNRLPAIDLAQEYVLLVDLATGSGNRTESHDATVRAVTYLKPLAQLDPPDRYYLVDYVTILASTPFPEFASAEEALAYSRKAVDLMHSKDPETLDLLAQCWLRAGNREEAIAAERKAIALLPPHKSGPVPEMRRRLEANLAALQAPAISASQSRSK